MSCGPRAGLIEHAHPSSSFAFAVVHSMIQSFNPPLQSHTHMRFLITHATQPFPLDPHALCTGPPVCHERGPI